LESVVADWLDLNLPPEYLRAAMEMGLAGAVGTLAGARLTREAVSTSEGVIWREPPSAFVSYDAPRPANNIQHVRLTRSQSLEASAGALGVDVADLALWEQGCLPPRRVAEAIAADGGFSLEHVLRSATGPEWDSHECNRCEEPEPSYGEMQEDGWDVVLVGDNTTELVCPQCLSPDDLVDW